MFMINDKWAEPVSGTLHPEMLKWVRYGMAHTARLCANRHLTGALLLRAASGAVTHVTCHAK